MGFLRGGWILWVDLTGGKVWREPTEKYEKFIGGRGINTKIVYDHVRPGSKAYDEGNVIVFGTGPLTGTLAPGGGRTEITSKSPMNELLGMTNMGGYWAAELKYAGYDHLAIRGKADRPVYLSIRDDEVEIRDASSIWGKDTYEVTPIIRREMGEPDAQVVMIGQAGENLVRYASVITKLGNAAGKTGMGGVMGSKNLKAIAVRGTRGVQMADPDAYFQLCAEAREAMNTNAFVQAIVKDGTIGEPLLMSASGLRVTGNSKESVWKGFDAPGLTKFNKDNTVKRTGCFSCPIQCMDLFSVDGIGRAVISCAVYTDPLWKAKTNDTRLWYESVSLCQRYGLDFNTVYAAIGWAIDLFERGILTEEDTGGLRLEPGTRDSAITVIEKIARREGIGDLLADGPAIASKRLGRGSEKYAYHTKGVPHQSANQLNYRTRALATAVGPRSDPLKSDGGFPITIDAIAMSGTQEQKAYYAAELERRIGKSKAMDPLGYDDKGRFIAFMEKVTAISDMFMHCKWHGMWIEGPVEPEQLAKFYTVGTGKAHPVGELWEAAERLRMLERAFNLREGLTRDDDTLPKKYFEEPLPGQFPNDVIDREKFERMKDEYYREMGLDEKTGLPTREALQRLGLAQVADDLEKAGRLAVPVPVEAVVG